MALRTTLTATWMAACLIAIGSPAVAQIVEVNFDDQTIGVLDDGSSTITSFPEIPVSSGDYALRVNDATSGAFYLAGSTVTHTDFTMTLDVLDWETATPLNQGIGLSNGTLSGVLLNGYALLIVPASNAIAIVEFTNSVSATLDGASVSLDPSTNDYVLVFERSGTSLSGYVANANTPTTALATVSASDGSFTSGSPAIVVTETFVDGIDATVDNFCASATIFCTEPEITLIPTSLTPSVTEGQDAANQSFTVENSGGTLLDYTVFDDVGWLSVSPTSGTSTGEADSIDVTYATSGLSLGVHNATITVSDPFAMNSPQTVAVTLTVAPGPNLEIITEIIDSSGDGGGNTLAFPEGVAVDVAGNAYVAGTSGGDNVFRITPLGVVTEIIDATGDGGGNTLNDAFGIAVDGSGNIYISGRQSDNAFKITTPGNCSTGGTPCTITEIIDSSGDGGGNTLDEPRGIAVDGAGDVYVAGSGSDNAFRIATPGTCSTGGTPCTITEIIDSSGDGGGNTLNNAYNVATDGNGNIFVAGENSDNAFKIATPGTCNTGGTVCTITEIIDSSGDGGGNTLDGPQGIAVNGSNDIYIAATNSQNVFKITASLATITEIIDSTGDGAGNALGLPRSAAVDGAGNVYVAGSSTDNAFQIDSPGTCSTGGTACTITVIIDSSGDGEVNPLDNPRSIAAHVSGTVYVTGQFSHNAFRIGDQSSPNMVPSLSPFSVALLGSMLGLAGWRMRRSQASR